MHKKLRILLLSTLLAAIIGGCGVSPTIDVNPKPSYEIEEDDGEEVVAIDLDIGEDEDEAIDKEDIWEGEGKEEDIVSEMPLETPSDSLSEVSSDDGLVIPAYNGSPYVAVNGNEPFFSTEERTSLEPFETYSEFDDLGRCGVAYANICRELMPTDSRESISEVKPSGWKNKPYDFVDGGYIYNRCHLIGFQLAGENANALNLVTGTRYMNVTGMLPFENMIADYVKETDNHVLYRVTPIYNGSNLVADGVLMEAYSVEDEGDGILFNVFCYNVQPGCSIDYATGDNWANGDADVGKQDDSKSNDNKSNNEPSLESASYILNTNSMKFHTPDCTYGKKTSESNKQEYFGTRESLIKDGYEPCGSCKP